MNFAPMDYEHMTAAQLDELESAFYCGSCMYLAIALHRLYGYPIQARFLDDDTLEHAWVRSPDGDVIDIMGKFPPEMLGFEVTHEDLDEGKFKCYIEAGVEVEWDEAPIEESIKIIEQYLLPRYHFTTLTL